MAVFFLIQGVGRRAKALNPAFFRPRSGAIGMTFGSNGRDPSYPQGISTPDFLFPDDALNSSCTFSLQKGVELRFYDSL